MNGIYNYEIFNTQMLSWIIRYLMNIVHNYDGFSMWMEYIIMRYSEYEWNLELWESF